MFGSKHVFYLNSQKIMSLINMLMFDIDGSPSLNATSITWSRVSNVRLMSQQGIFAANVVVSAATQNNWLNDDDNC